MSSRGGGYGGSSYGGGGYGGGGFGGRSGRSSRGGYGSSGYGNSGYNAYGSGGQTSYGNNQYGGGYGGRSSRGGRNNSRYNNGSNYQTYGGNVGQGANQNINITGGNTQTQSTGSSTARRRALTGNANRGAIGGAPGGAGSSDGGISIQAGTAPPAGGAPGRAPARKTAPAAGKGRAPSGPEMKVRSKTTLLLSSKSSAVVVNEPFDLNVTLANPGSLEFDTLSFAVQYDPRTVMPVAGKDKEGNWVPLDAVSLKTKIKQEDISTSVPGRIKFGNLFANSGEAEITTNKVDTTNGIIQMELKVKDKPVDGSGIVSSISMVPLNDVRQTTIRFMFDEPGKEKNEKSKPLTSLYLGSDDQLGSKVRHDDGAINLSLEVYDSDEQVKNRNIIKNAGDRFDDEEASTLSTHLHIIPRQKQVDVGDMLEVDVYLANPDLENIDSINLLIAFNPRYFEVEDSDSIQPGVNLDDKDYKDKFSFDFPMMNVADNRKGIIDYRVQGFGKPVRSEGEFVTIRLRALRPTKKSTFRVLMNQSGESPTTSVVYKNRDRLGDSSRWTDGVTTSSVEIRPTMAYLKKLGFDG